jgi:hypothetical protein
MQAKKIFYCLFFPNRKPENHSIPEEKQKITAACNMRVISLIPGGMFIQLPLLKQGPL